MEPDTQFVLEYKRIEEAAKTARWRCLSVCGTIAVIAIVIGVVKVVDKPPWMSLTALVILSLIGPSGVIRELIRSRRKCIDKHHRRCVDLEKRLDPQRESSDLKPEEEEPDKKEI